MTRRLILAACVVAMASWAGAAYGVAYSNDFNTADAVDDWVVQQGTWVLDPVAGTYANTTTAATALSVYMGTYAGGVDASVLRDYTVTAEVAVNGGSAGVVARYNDSANYYLFRYKPEGDEAGQLQLYRFANGATRIGTETINPATVPLAHTLVLDVKGKKITGRIFGGGSELGSVTANDDAHSSGSVGLREWNGPSTFSSIRVDIIGNSFDPSPADGAVDVPTDAVLTWYTGLNPDDLSQPNSAITKHYVYMSTDINDILFNWETVLVDTVPAAGPTATHTPANLAPDTTYYWAVDQSVNDSGPSDAETILGSVWSFDTIKTLPIVSSGPNDVFVEAGGTAELSVAVNSGSETHYAWYKGGVGDTSTPVGGDSAVLSIAAVQAANEGTYWCRVTNIAGSADSGAANLYIKRLLAHWTMDEADYSAGQYADTAGGNHATAAGEPNFVTGADGSEAGAAVIDATNGWATDGTWDPNAATGSMTISMWANWSGINSQHQRLISKRDIDWGTTRWHLMLEPYSTTVEFESFADGSGPTGTMVHDGGWQHVCVSFDGSVATLYINGTDEFDLESASSATVALTPETEGSTINIGAGKTDGTLWFNGALDDIRIYNHPMTPEEVAETWMDVTQKDPKINCPASDLTGDCKTNFADIAMVADEWLQCGLFTDCP